MVRRFHRSIYDELDDLKASMDYLFQLVLEPVDDPLLPAGENPGIVCQYPHNLNAEVTDDDDEVMVTVDTIPGIGMTKISVELFSPDTLKITCHRQEDSTEDDDRSNLDEQRSFSLYHVIRLPCPVMTRGAKSTFINGVLDIHLRKAYQEEA
jgi:HSP20 family molecular chaperone IbpA